MKMADDEITFEDVENYKTSTGGSFKEIVLRRYEEALRLSSKELIASKEIREGTKVIMINEISVFTNCVRGLYITLKPKIEEKRKHPLLKEILKQYEEKEDEYNKWLIKARQDIEEEIKNCSTYNQAFGATTGTKNPLLKRYKDGEKNEFLLDLAYLKLEIISNLLTILDWFDELTASGG